MEEKETVDIIADLNEGMESFLRTRFVEGDNLRVFRYTIQACFTLAHFIAKHVDPELLLTVNRIHVDGRDDDDEEVLQELEETLHELESDVSDVMNCMDFFSCLQNDMKKFIGRKLGKTRKELEVMALIANELVDMNKPSKEDD